MRISKYDLPKKTNVIGHFNFTIHTFLFQLYHEFEVIYSHGNILVKLWSYMKKKEIYMIFFELTIYFRILEIISTFSTNETVEGLLDIYNIFIGVFIFIIFVFKRKVFYELKCRFGKEILMPSWSKFFKNSGFCAIIIWNIKKVWKPGVLVQQQQDQQQWHILLIWVWEVWHRINYSGHLAQPYKYRKSDKNDYLMVEWKNCSGGPFSQNQGNKHIQIFFNICKL